jgi:hypothetical protein
VRARLEGLSAKIVFNSWFAAYGMMVVHRAGIHDDGEKPHSTFSTTVPCKWPTTEKCAFPFPWQHFIFY